MKIVDLLGGQAEYLSLIHILLPIILDAEADERKQYKSAAQLVNSKLKKLGEQIGLPIPLTSYVAKHNAFAI